MNNLATYIVKEEPKDENQSFVPALTPSQGLIEFFLDNEYKKDDISYYYSKVKCLDETDGNFKYFADLSLNRIKPEQEGDYKNYCSKCGVQFNSLLAAQNHFIYTHPDPCLLTKIIPALKNTSHTVKDYNWLDEPIPCKPMVKSKRDSPNIIVIKNKEEYLKKLSRTQNLARVTEDVPNLSMKGYTLERIKIHPQKGIRVVKKSDIKFDKLRMRAEHKLSLCKKAEPRVGEAPSKKNNEPIRQLMKIDIENALKKYLTTATFLCPLCKKTFFTRIGISQHTESCISIHANNSDSPEIN